MPATKRQPRESTKNSQRGALAPDRIAAILKALDEAYPNVECALIHRTPWELLVATILSAQCTDVRVNMVTPALFAAYPTAEALAEASQADVEEIIRSTGFFRSKAQNLIGMAEGVVDRFGGEVPTGIEDLVSLPGVGRKTANVVRSVAFDLPGLPVDTHVGRLARRLELVDETDPVKAEHALNELIPASRRGVFSIRLILHGRATCVARGPRCGTCPLSDLCPSSSRNVTIHRRPSRGGSPG